MTQGPRLEISGNIAKIYGLTAKAIGAEPKGGSPELNQVIAGLIERIILLEEEVSLLKQPKSYELSFLEESPEQIDGI